MKYSNVFYVVHIFLNREIV